MKSSLRSDNTELVSEYELESLSSESMVNRIITYLVMLKLRLVIVRLRKVYMH